MITKRLTFALIAVAFVAAAVVVAAAKNLVGLDGLIGIGAVVSLIGVAAIDYRSTLPRVLR